MAAVVVGALQCAKSSRSEPWVLEEQSHSELCSALWMRGAHFLCSPDPNRGLTLC